MEDNPSFPELQINQEATVRLTEASRWGKFFGILVLCGTGLFFLLVLFLWNRIAGQLLVKEDTDEQTLQILKIFVIAVVLIMGVIAGVLMSFLVKGANRIRNGIRNNDQLLFNSGLSSLRNYFSMYAVLGIIGLFFSLIGLLIR
jgi:heme/copper-type cytochrome/quinol oxidase subunit 2